MKLMTILGALLAPTFAMNVAHADGRSWGDIGSDVAAWGKQAAHGAGEYIRESVSGVVPKAGDPGTQAPPPATIEASGQPVTLCIGYGTEKKPWLMQEAKAYTLAHPEVTLQMIGTGSFEGARAISTSKDGEVAVIKGDGVVIKGGKEAGSVNSCAMTVWSPASSLFRSYAAGRYFNDSVLRGTLQPNATVNDVYAAEADSLVHSPMVLVLWKHSALDKLIADYNQSSSDKIDANKLTDPATIQKLSNAISLKYVMDEQAKKVIRPLNMTNPLTSNSGFSFVYILSGELLSDPQTASKSQDLQIDPDLGVPAAATDSANEALWVPLLNMTTRNFNGQLRSLNNYLVDSTGTLMDQFLATGPTLMSGIMTYENLALDMGRKPINQGDEYQIVYPKINIMADHPYYVLNLPNRSSDQKKAAVSLMKFLRGPEAQAAAVQMGFRPGVAGLNLSLQDSPAFADGRARGVTLDLTSVGHFVQTMVDPQTTANIEDGFKSNVLASICAVPANTSKPEVYKACQLLQQQK